MKFIRKNLQEYNIMTESLQLSFSFSKNYFNLIYDLRKNDFNVRLSTIDLNAKFDLYIS